MKTPLQVIKESLNLVDLHPSLEEAMTGRGLDRKRLTVALKSPIAKLDVSAREEVFISDGTNAVCWKVPSLRALFRGDTVAPSMGTEPPFEYQPIFHFIERHVLLFSDAVGDKTDGEFEEAFSNLRRRPDGKPLNALHFFLWQVGAGLLGIRPLSASEFDAVFGRLARSAQTFSIGLVSRNYVSVLRDLASGRL